MAEVSDSALDPIGEVHRTAMGREATEPLRDDIRLLGAILGETVREQTATRCSTSSSGPASRRSGCADPRSAAQLVAHVRGIDIRVAIPVIRAFSHFPLLANLAEDLHRERRRAVHVAAGAPPQDSSLAATYLETRSAHLDAATVADALTGALVSPVITAHPDRDPPPHRLRHPAPDHRADAAARGRATRDRRRPRASNSSCAARSSRCGRPR